MDPAAPSTTGTDSRSAPPSFDTRRVRAMVRRSLLSQSRNPDFWFLLLVLPLVDGLLFGSIGVAYGIGDAPVVLLVTGIMLFHLIWQLTLAGSFGLLDEVWSRNLLNETHIYRRSNANDKVLGSYANFNPPRTFGFDATINF